MDVSVIIPVFNSVKELDAAVGSALFQPEVSEILLIDDHSTDGSADLCRKWAAEEEKVHFFCTGGSQNLGSAVARNIGLQHASCPFIAFLDADDHYLKGRFTEDKLMFGNFPDAVGICNSTRVLTWNHTDIRLYNQHLRHGMVLGYDMSFLKIDLSSLFLANSMHLNGLTIKREILPKLGFFDETLRQGQDIDFMFRLGLAGALYSTDQASPKAIYTIHQNNTIFREKEAIYYRRKVFRKLFHLSLSRLRAVDLSIKFMAQFLEFDFLNKYGTGAKNKRLRKIFRLPVSLFALLSPVNEDEKVVV